MHKVSEKLELAMSAEVFSSADIKNFGDLQVSVLMAGFLVCVVSEPLCIPWLLLLSKTALRDHQEPYT